MTRELVVDCSALFDALVLPRKSRLTDLLAAKPLHAPHLLDFEFLSALRKHAAKASLGATAAMEKLELFEMMSIERHDAEYLRRRIWMMRHNLTAYAAAYVALAEALNLPLATSDLKLAAVAANYCKVLTP
ncbi:MAG: type II toxin-antitoxin system VapC family toxin [Homoserinimonas sp.]|nr:type II toxin-antitoxin system VapC family toxin [Homoserinimonas sp.]